jgi:urease accessory protein
MRPTPPHQAVEAVEAARVLPTRTAQEQEPLDDIASDVTPANYADCVLPIGSAALLALADQRLPSGGHVHSGGVEQAITDALVHDVPTLEGFLERRLRTTGLVSAGLAAAACFCAADSDAADAVHRLDLEADARTPSPAQRVASRSQGRGLIRTARAAWAAPTATLSWSDLGARPHHPLVLGCAARAGGVSPEGAALVAAYLSVSAPSTAAQRLLALDPVTVAAVTIRLGPAIESTAALAVRGLLRSRPIHSGPIQNGPASSDPSSRGETRCGQARSGQPRSDEPGSDRSPSAFDLPDDSDPLLDLLAERHAAREERLFAS